MTTSKLEFSLRLRHDSADLQPIARLLNLAANDIWRKGDQKGVDSEGRTRLGNYDSSYCNLALEVAATTSLEDGLSECLAKLQPKAAEIAAFVRAGGIASLAVAWFSDSVGGDRISNDVLVELASMHLTLDIYLYLSTT